MPAKQTVIRWTACAEQMPPPFALCYAALHQFMSVGGLILWTGERWENADHADKRPLRQDFVYWSLALDLTVDEVRE